LLLLAALSAGSAAAAWNPLCIFTLSCGEAPPPIVVSEEQQRLDIEFEMLFGPAPVITKPERRTWDQNRKLFGGLIEVPTGSTLAAVDFAAGYYASVAVPRPLFYKLGKDERAQFRAGPVLYGTSAQNAVGNLQISAASFHVAAIKAGVCVPHPHAWVPTHLLEGNEERCNAKK
jgi:hypothetical protein